MIFGLGLQKNYVVLPPLLFYLQLLQNIIVTIVFLCTNMCCDWLPILKDV